MGDDELRAHFIKEMKAAEGRRITPKMVGYNIMSTLGTSAVVIALLLYIWQDNKANVTGRIDKISQDAQTDRTKFWEQFSYNSREIDCIKQHLAVITRSAVNCN